MQKIGMLAMWEPIDQDSYFVVPAGRNRRAQIEVNAPDPCGLWWYPLDKDGKPKKSGGENFLALVQGFDAVEFVAGFDVAVVPDGRCWINVKQTRVIEPHEATDSFTQIVERRAVDPTLAYVRRQSLLNQQRTEAKLAEAIRRIEALSAAPNNEVVNEPQPDNPPADQSASAPSDAEPTGEPKPGEGAAAPAPADGKGGAGDGG